ncbi:MAG: toll/interleukin-1 receptor domain-containing protein [Rhodococcus sp.]|nr:toll/interleukin-1 receptor domain-containing protein [Rhodococcus sp. (in: high G+C Gram-positive bacteria)]
MHCTAPVQGHRSASAAANCPACRSRSYTPSYYPAPDVRYRSSSGGSYGGSSSRSAGRASVSYTAAEQRTLAPVRRAVERQAQSYPDRRDLFLCHAWDDRRGAAQELHDQLESLGVTVWFSEKDVALGTSLIREIDKGLRKSRIGIVLVTPALFTSLDAEGVADKELSALLATDRVIPVAHGTTFEALRDVSPLLAARSGLSTGDSSLEDVAAKIADTVRV